MCDQVFEGKGEVYNANGIDITNSFLTRYNAIYQSGNYDAILSGCFKEGSTLQANEMVIASWALPDHRPLSQWVRKMPLSYFGIRYLSSLLK